MKLFANGVTYHAEITARAPDKPDLLMLHGFMGSGRGFTELTKHLSHQCNPVTVDLVGHGQTITPTTDPGRFSTGQQVSDLLSILDRFQFSNLWLYGYSMGGRLAQHLYLADPVRFRGLILESTHCGITDPEKRSQRRTTDEEKAREIETNFTAFLERWKTLDLFNGPSSPKTRHYDTVMNRQNPQLMAASLRGFGAGSMPPVCDKLSKIFGPTLLICGSLDQKYVDKMREMNHLMPVSNYSVVSGAAHRVHADQPHKTAILLTQFIESHA